MKKTNVLVVEDEVIIAKDITQTLQKLGYHVTGHCTTGEAVANLIDAQKPDIILMDIMLKGEMTGIDAAKEVRRRYEIPVVYLTAYSDESSLTRAIATSPSGYLVKPFKPNDLRATIETALHNFREEKELKQENKMLYNLVQNKSMPEILFVKSDFTLIKVPLKDILFVEALKDYVTLFTTTDKKYIIRSTMKGIQNKLPSEFFARVHRSYIVRMDKILSIDHNRMILEYNKEIPIGGLYKEEFLNRINSI